MTQAPPLPAAPGAAGAGHAAAGSTTDAHITAGSVPSCHSDAGGPAAAPGAPVVALAGSPNVGKSTLFNALTGARRQMGNWPGTSVEVGRGAWRLGHATGDMALYYQSATVERDRAIADALDAAQPAESPTDQP